METNEQSSIFRYILIIVSFSIALVIYLKRKSQPTGESIQETIWRKIVFAYQDMLHTFDYAEKELLKHTYHNTIFNSKGINVSNGKRKDNKKKSSGVQFNLNKNETLYY
ncbi:unnamed protein product [Paramecium octaurelia]|uniref:Uncharacterized protein n=1 Tax=Paramecium octaurelia TaxID=43137 RepID=A0A8S1V7H4_PAROT|nr:unnamed protein product [Paramecium octaurelia]